MCYYSQLNDINFDFSIFSQEQSALSEVTHSYTNRWKQVALSGGQKYCQSGTHADSNYQKVTSSNTSCLEAHAGFFRLLMKGIFDPYEL